MTKAKYCTGLAAAILATCLIDAPASAQQADMGFFITSSGGPSGANVGGLAGADALCQTRAEAAGDKGNTWRAYLSTQAVDGTPAINARDRIGKGPWANAKGVVIAKDIAELHGTNNLGKLTALTEKGDMVNGRGDTPNTHDILTGTLPDGSAPTVKDDQTCGNWTKGGAEGAAIVGHFDRAGLDTSPPMLSWNSSHLTRGGCSPDALKSTGGAGLLYCFAAK